MIAIAGAARVATITIVLAAAAAFGLVVGNTLQGRGAADQAGLGNFVPNNPGGTAVTAGPAWVDYGVRHLAARQEYLDLGLRMIRNADASAADGAGSADGGARPE